MVNSQRYTNFVAPIKFKVKKQNTYMTEKQTVFLAIVNRFLEIWRGTQDAQEQGNARQHFTRVKIMKLFYFFCMLDEQAEIRNSNLFGHFVAYPFGPVNEEAYEFLKSEIGNCLFEAMCRNEKVDLPLLTPEIENIIDNILQSPQIGENGMEIHVWNNLIKMPVDELVELSHQTTAWREAYLYSSEHDMNIEDNLAEDKRLILKILSNWGTT